METGARTTASPDPGQEAALEKAAEALRTSNGDAKQAAERCITAWIMQRAVDAAKARGGTEQFLLSLGGDASRMEGTMLGSLPRIADGLMKSGIDLSKPVFDMAKEDIAKMFSIATLTAREVSITVQERPDFPFDDEIPF